MNSVLPRLLRLPARARRVALALAWLAVLGIALVPTVSRLLKPPGGAATALVACHEAPAPHGGAAAAHAQSADVACALCVLAHFAPSLNSLPPEAWTRTPFRPVAPPAFVPAPAPDAAPRALAQARAPPRSA